MVTVIIPTYRPQEYIEECLKSLDMQTLDKNQFEVLVILNGEKEPYYSEVNRLLSSFSFNSRLLFSDVPGVSNARNIGLDNANGEYICFIDDDDFISPEYLNNLYLQIANNHNSIAVSNVKTFDDHSKQFGSDYISKAFDYYSTHHTNSIFKKRKFLSSSCCKLIPKSIIGSCRFNPAYKIGEDSLFMFSISKSIEHIELASGATIYYRRLRSRSASHLKRKLKDRIFGIFSLIKAYTQLYLSNITQYNFFLFISRIVAIIKTY